MVKAIHFLKPAWCGKHSAGLWPEQDLHSVTKATAFQAVAVHLDSAASALNMSPGLGQLNNHFRRPCVTGHAFVLVTNHKNGARSHNWPGINGLSRRIKITHTPHSLVTNRPSF